MSKPRAQAPTVPTVPTMPKTYGVRFVRDHTVNAVDGATYVAGQVVSFDSVFSAEHFVRRGLAEYYRSGPLVPAPKPDAADPKASDDADPNGSDEKV